MDKYTYQQQIRTLYNNRDYENTIDTIYAYLHKYNETMNEQYLNIYINCLIELGLFTTAVKQIDKMIELYPIFYNNYGKAMKYASCGNVSKLEELLQKCTFTDDEYYYLAKKCYFNGNKELAEKLFNHVLIITTDKKKINSAKDFLKFIEIKKNHPDSFEESEYPYFKSRGYSLKPGHIVYAKTISNYYKINRYITDPSRNTKPYMIWKIEDDKIYAFQVSTKIKKEGNYILYKEDYPNRDTDRIVKDNLVCINEKDIDKIIDEIKPSHFERAIRNVYRSICLQDNLNSMENQPFIDAVHESFNIGIYDIMVIYDKVIGKCRYYFVLEYREDIKHYKVIELKRTENEDIMIKKMQVHFLKSRLPIFYNIKLSKNDKQKILEQIPDSFKENNLLGSIVEYNGQALEILLTDKKFFICLDKTNNDAVRIEFISKYMPYKILRKASEEEYQNDLTVINNYIANNEEQYKEKKKIYKQKMKF